MRIHFSLSSNNSIVTYMTGSPHAGQLISIGIIYLPYLPIVLGVFTGATKGGAKHLTLFTGII
jgi:hypothetical protein